MLKKTITYEDFDGRTRTEDFYFNMTKAEAMEMEISGEGNSFSSQMQKIVEANDGKTIVATFKELILKAYGEKSEDGRKFIKSKELSDEFAQTAAFSELFMELATDADAGSAFVRGVLPANLDDSVNEVKKPQDHLPKHVQAIKTETVELPEEPVKNEIDIENLSQEQVDALKAKLLGNQGDS